MPRFFDPGRYNEDWYIDLKGEYQKFYDFIIEMCDNAGVWKPNKFDFEAKTGFKLNLDSFLKKVNGDKERIIVLENGRWFIPGFIQYQFFNKKSSFEFTSHPLHKNIQKSIELNEIPQGLIKGLSRAYQALKDKDIVFNNRVEKIEIKKTEVWNTKPDGSCISLELPEIKIGAIVQQFRFTDGIKASNSQVLGLWEVFKVQNFTGEKFYQSKGDVFSHFINWCRGKKLKDELEMEVENFKQPNFSLKKL